MQPAALLTTPKHIVQEIPATLSCGSATSPTRDLQKWFDQLLIVSNPSKASNSPYRPVILNGVKVLKRDFPFCFCFLVSIYFLLICFKTGFPRGWLKSCNSPAPPSGVQGLQVRTSRPHLEIPPVISTQLLFALWTASAPKALCVFTASELPALWWANHIPPWIRAFRKLIIFVPNLVYANCTLKLHNLVQYHPTQTILSVKESCNLYENKFNV